MTRIFLAIAVATVLLVSVNAQPKGAGAGARPTNKLTAAEAPAPAGYEIDVVALKGQGILMMNVQPTHAHAGDDQTAFRGFLSDYFDARPLAASKLKRERPKVVIKFTEDDDIATLEKVVNTVSVSNNMSIELQPMLDDLRLFVPPKMSDAALVNVKPNPLTLQVEVNGEGAITLNEDDMGKLPDLSKLGSTLREIYHQREINGVFRENTNEIEKTISIKLAEKASAGDLIKIAKALQDVGADRIGFQTEGSPGRMDLLPIVMPGPKKPIK